MSKPVAPLLDLTPQQIRLRKRDVMRREILARRLPLLAWESLLQRLAGLLLHHPGQAGFVHAMTRRASGLRLCGDMDLARELAAGYEAHLAALGIAETWYDVHHDEAAILDRHYRAVSDALNKELGIAPKAVPGQAVTLRPQEDC